MKLIKSQAEIICGRRGEILRTEGRNSPDGGEKFSGRRKIQDARDFKAQRVRIINISPLLGHEEPADNVSCTEIG